MQQQAQASEQAGSSSAAESKRLVLALVSNGLYGHAYGVFWNQNMRYVTSWATVAVPVMVIILAAVKLELHPWGCPSCITLSSFQPKLDNMALCSPPSAFDVAPAVYTASLSPTRASAADTHDMILCACLPRVSWPGLVWCVLVAAVMACSSRP